MNLQYQKNFILIIAYKNKEIKLKSNKNRLYIKPIIATYHYLTNNVSSRIIKIPATIATKPIILIISLAFITFHSSTKLYHLLNFIRKFVTIFRYIHLYLKHFGNLFHCFANIKNRFPGMCKILPVTNRRLTIKHLTVHNIIYYIWSNHKPVNAFAA